MRYFIGDTETTGLKKPRACEVALVEITPDLEIMKKWESLIDPEKEIEPEAQAIHGISNDRVKFEPSMSEWVNEVIGGPITDEVTLIGHFVIFDKPMLAEVLTNIKKTFCTVAFARRLKPGALNHKLGTMAELYRLDRGEAHRAMSDCLTVLQLLKVMLPESGKTLLQQLAVPRNKILVMPFGEHKDKLLVDLPRGYRMWLMSLATVDEDLLKSLQELHKAGV